MNLIEDCDEEEEESINVAADDDPMISVDDKKGEIRRVATGSVNREHQPPEPVVLEPALPARSPTVVLKAKTKVAAKPKPDVRDQPTSEAAPKVSTSTVAPKVRPSQNPQSSSARRPESSSLPSSSDWADRVPDVIGLDVTGQNAGTSGDLWGAYTGNLTDVRDRPIGADPQMPTSTAPKGSGKSAWGRRHQASRHEWRPRIREETRDDARDDDQLRRSC